MKTSAVLRKLLQETTAGVMLESTRAAIEKIAAEAAKEMLADEEFRASLKAGVRVMAAEISAELRGRKTPTQAPRRGKRSPG